MGGCVDNGVCTWGAVLGDCVGNGVRTWGAALVIECVCEGLCW